jgi:hypothetical protein
MASVHKKLMEARIALQSVQMKKSGTNKFAGYQYFELGDFLPHIQKIFQDVGLCGFISYSNEYATLTITDFEDGSEITITSPMAEASLKGVHPIQNMGAVETYSRRYLWMTALEIVEHDALDSSEGAAVTIDVNMMADHITAINDATDEPSLIKAYQAAYKACGTDKAWQKKIIGVKDVKKAALK